MSFFKKVEAKYNAPKQSKNTLEAVVEIWRDGSDIFYNLSGYDLKVVQPKRLDKIVDLLPVVDAKDYKTVEASITAEFTYYKGSPATQLDPPDPADVDFGKTTLSLDGISIPFDDCLSDQAWLLLTEQAMEKGSEALEDDRY